MTKWVSRVAHELGRLHPMHARPLVIKDDYPILAKFWADKGQPPVPENCLPPLGLVVEDEGVIYCGAFLLKSDTTIACIGYLSANPDLPKSVRSTAIDFLIPEMVRLAKENGYTMITAATRIDALKKRYERMGFQKTDENVTYYARGTDVCLGLYQQ